jgi:hypothetical protein
MVRPLRAVFGQIPKWPTGEDCKSSGFAFTGSNPVLPILFDYQRVVILDEARHNDFA